MATVQVVPSGEVNVRVGVRIGVWMMVKLVGHSAI